MQLLLQNFLSFEDAYERAQLKKTNEKARMFGIANVTFALFDFSLLMPSYHYQFSYKLRLKPVHQKVRQKIASQQTCIYNFGLLGVLVLVFLCSSESYLLHVSCAKVNICMSSKLVPTAQPWHKNC